MNKILKLTIYHWRRRFYLRHNLTTRKKTNKKSLAMPIRIAKWKTYHIKFRSFMQSGKTVCPKYGLYKPEDRYNVDQVPLPFVFDGDETIEEVGTRTVIVKGCSGVDGEKRQATLQMCIRARGKQPRPAIIFRGQGRFLKAERKLYAERVDVYAQPKAWADRPFSLSWVKKQFMIISKREQPLKENHHSL